jgi:hypothetical protein
MAKIDTIKEFAELGFGRLDGALKDISEEQLDWKSCTEANTVRNIVSHLLGEWTGFIPKIIAANKDLEVKSYEAKPDASLADLMKDYEKGKIDLMSKLDKVKDEDLGKELDWFMGKKNMGFYLMLGVSEIIHHEGQIAAIRGVNKRLTDA